MSNSTILVYIIVNDIVLSYLQAFLSTTPVLMHKANCDKIAKCLDAAEKNYTPVIYLLNTQGVLLVQEKGRNGRLLHIQAMQSDEVKW